jgi:demethylmenaquinone methyltransferase/2-methoxy-6-polyprenyl-1,4-benzoquinol methylase
LNYNTFMQPAYHSALATSAFPSGSCGLDLGCGPGGLLPLLAEQIGPAGHIVGVDVSRPHLTAARHLVADQGMEERVSVEWADLARPLPFADSVFDWVWCADTLWPGGSFDPVAAVREAARVTKPGGKIALWFIALRRGIVLPGEPLVEYTLRMAMDRTLYPAAPTALHSETALQWLRDAGLIDLRLSAHHVLARPPFDTAVRGYLEEYLLTEMRRIPRESVPEIGDDAWARWRRLSDPAAPEYLLNQPDYYCLQFGLLASGGVPDELQ